MKKLLLSAAFAVLLSAQTANTATFDVSFQFTGTDNLSNLPATVTVTGTIVTDCDSCFLQQTDISSWSFTFSGGLTGSASGGTSDPPGITGNVLSASGGVLTYESGGDAIFTGTGQSQMAFGLNVETQLRAQILTSENVLGSVTLPFQIATEEIVSTTPLPAALPLFATGLGGLGLLGWRRKRKAQAVA
jgi:hypothetical protein